MQRLVVGVILACTAFVGLCSGQAATARAIAIPALSGPARVLHSDVIATGRVVAIADQDIEVAAAPKSKAKVVYRIAIVQIEELVKGKAPNNIIQVGFIAPTNNKNNPPAVVPPGGIRPLPFPGRPGFNITLTVGQEGLFFLKKHPEGKFHILPTYNTFIVKNDNNPDFLKQQIQEARATMKVLDDKMSSLKSKDINTRLETASVLIQLYRSTTGGPIKQVPIDAEESQLILKALADADWDRSKYQGVGKNYQHYPYNLFSRLGIGPQDGFQRPNVGNVNAFAAAAKAWVQKNWKTYRIQKYVSTGNPGVGYGGPGRVIGQPGRPVIGGPVQGVPVGPIQIQPVQPVNPIQKIQPIKR